MDDVLPSQVRIGPPRRWGAARRFARNLPAVASAVTLGVLLFIAFTAPAWLPHGPDELFPDQFAAPSAAHWLGTDANGRDVTARVCAGARVSVIVGIAGALVSLGIGVTWGALAGYAGGRVDGVLMRTVDILYSLPSVVIIIVLLSVFQAPAKEALARWGGEDAAEDAPLLLLVLGLGGISWLTMARIVRGHVLSLSRRPFVEASMSLGAGHVRLLWKHILPNTAGVIVVYLTLTIPAVVLAESFLSYLGLGIQPPRASLGTLIAEGAGQINPIHTRWWLLAGPGVPLVILLLALSFVGDGLRDAFRER